MADMSRIAELRALLAKLPDERFNMTIWSGVWVDGALLAANDIYPRLEVCGTVGCMAGWAAALAAKERKSLFSLSIEIMAAEHLGIDKAEADYIFLGRWFPTNNDNGLADLGTIKRADVLSYLDDVLRTGDVYCREPGIFTTTATATDGDQG